MKIKRKKIKVKPNNLPQSKYVPLISRMKKTMGWFLDNYLLNSKRKVPSGLTQRPYEKERELLKQKNQNQKGSKRKKDQRLDQYQELHQNKWSNKIKQKAGPNKKRNQIIWTKSKKRKIFR